MLLLFGTTFMGAEVIKIPPIVIHSNTKKENSPDSTTSILSNLKRAIAKNQNSHKLSKEEEAKVILEGLKRKINTHAKPLVKNKVKKQKKSIKKKSIKRKIHPPKKKQNIKIVKKSIKKKIAPVKKKPKVRIVKKKIASTKRKPKVRTVKKRAKVVTVKTQPTFQQQRSHVKTTTPQSTKPIGFVKTLGVVGKSQVYEVNDLAIDEREEVTNDGVVDMATATTDRLENLPFVKPLEVIEVTEPFEASEAKKYQLDKR